MISAKCAYIHYSFFRLSCIISFLYYFFFETPTTAIELNDQTRKQSLRLSFYFNSIAMHSEAEDFRGSTKKSKLDKFKYFTQFSSKKMLTQKGLEGPLLHLPPCKKPRQNVCLFLKTICANQWVQWLFMREAIHPAAMQSKTFKFYRHLLMNLKTYIFRNLM